MIKEKIDKLNTTVYHKLKPYADKPIINLFNPLGNFIAIFIILGILYILPVKNNHEIALVSLTAFMINTIIVFILKFSFRKKRQQITKNFFFRLDPYSFPSGHVSRLAGFIFTTSPLPYLPPLFFLLSLMTGFARISKGYHRFFDCAVAFFIGLSCSLTTSFFSATFLKLFEKTSLL